MLRSLRLRPLGPPGGAGDLTVGMTGLAGAISLAALNLVIFFYDRDISTQTAGNDQENERATRAPSPSTF